MLSFKLSLVSLNLLLLHSAAGDKGNGCVIDPSVEDYPKYPPLFLDNNHNWLVYNGTDDDKALRIDSGENILFDCSITRYFAHFGKEVKSLWAKCVSGTNFTIIQDGKLVNIDFSLLECNRQPKEKFRRKGKCPGAPNFNYYEVGYHIYSGFKVLYSICFDTIKDRTLWSRNLLRYEIDTKDDDSSKPKFYADFVYDYDVSPNFSFENQRQTLAILLKSEELANKYITMEKSHFFSRGHLSARADFVYPTWQDATFRYTNVAPQWQSFNARNWRVLEDQFRNYAIEKNEDFVVYSGTHGVLGLKDINNNTVDIYLHLDKYPDIPVPKLFWKAFVNTSEKEGVIFFGVNNPYVEESELFSENYIICSDHVNHPIMDNIDYPKDIQRGYMYTCRASDVQDILEGFPPELRNMNTIEY